MRYYTTIFALLCTGLFFGWFSARLMLEQAGGGLQRGTAGWEEIRVSDDGFHSVYQSGHFLWQGKLPPPQNTRLFRRDSDDDGNTLRSDCSTLVEGRSPQARWWMIAAGNGEYTSSLGAGSIIREEDNSFTVTFSPVAGAGNWLKISGNQDYSLYFSIDDGDVASEPTLPHVRRLYC